MNLLFVCHGNICRSPMAEFVMKHLVRQHGLNDVYVESCATSREEIGNDIHYGTRTKLMQTGIAFERRAARQMTIHDYSKFDLILAMDYENLYYIDKIIGRDSENKVHLLLEFAPQDYDGGVKSRQGTVKEIADPWYTGNFDNTFEDILAGCTGLIDFLAKNK